MRLLLYSFLLLTILAAACKKHNDTGNDSPIGNWKLISFTNGFIGQTCTVPADSVCLLTLNDNHTFSKATNGTVNGSGSYYILTMNSIFTGRQEPAISFFNPLAYSAPLLFAIHQDTLDLIMNAYDGNSYRYVRYTTHPTAGGK